MGSLFKQYWETEGLSANRHTGYYKLGATSNFVVPTTYRGYGGRTKPSTTPTFPNGGRATLDIPNEAIIYYFYSQGPFNYLASARNKAWSKFVDKVRTGPASLGVTLAEWNQSLGMVTKRSTQLYRGYRALRKGDFRAFTREFAIDPKRKHKSLVRSSANSASNLWLEYSFGWKPAVVDIYAGLNAISQPVPGGKVSGSGFQSVVQGYHAGTGHVKIGAEVYVTNPNLYLLQQLGVANPLLVAWELVPFSFMVDWVFDIGTCLGAVTDLLGCSVQNPYSTAFVKTTGVKRRTFVGKPYPAADRTVKIWAMQREPKLVYPLPNTQFRANIGSSLNRAANAVSLLGQILTK